MLDSRFTLLGCCVALIAALGAATCGCSAMTQTTTPEELASRDRPEATQTADPPVSGSSTDLPETRTLSVSGRAAFEAAIATTMDPTLVDTLTVEATRDRKLRAYIDLAPDAQFPDDRQIYVLLNSVLSRPTRSREIYLGFTHPEPDGSVRLLSYEWKAYPGEMSVTGATAPAIDSLELEFIEAEDRVVTNLTRKRIEQIAAGNEPVPR